MIEGRGDDLSSSRGGRVERPTKLERGHFVDGETISEYHQVNRSHVRSTNRQSILEISATAFCAVLCRAESRLALVTEHA